MTKKIRPFSIEPRLPYPTITHTRANDGIPPMEEYVIPKSHRKKVLHQMYPFAGPPKLTDVMVEVEGEKLRPITWVIFEDVKSGDWGIAGNAPTLEDARAVQSGAVTVRDAIGA